MGGKPSKGTPKDMRLSMNQKKQPMPLKTPTPKGK